MTRQARALCWHLLLGVVAVTAVFVAHATAGASPVGEPPTPTVWQFQPATVDEARAQHMRRWLELAQVCGADRATHPCDLIGAGG